MTLNCGNNGIFLIMGNAGFISSTVPQHPQAQEVYFTERPPAVAVQALQCWLAIIIACGCQSEDMSDERERETPKPEALNPRK